MLFVYKTIVLETTLAFRDRQIVIIGSRRLYIEKVSSFASANPFGVDFISTFFLIVFHRNCRI